MRYVIVISLALIVAWFLAPSPVEVGQKLVPSIDSIAESARNNRLNQQGN